MMKQEEQRNQKSGENLAFIQLKRLGLDLRHTKEKIKGITNIFREKYFSQSSTFTLLETLPFDSQQEILIYLSFSLLGSQFLQVLSQYDYSLMKLKAWTRLQQLSKVFQQIQEDRLPINKILSFLKPYLLYKMKATSLTQTLNIVKNDELVFIFHTIVLRHTKSNQNLSNLHIFQNKRFPTTPIKFPTSIQSMIGFLANRQNLGSIPEIEENNQDNNRDNNQDHNKDHNKDKKIREEIIFNTILITNFCGFWYLFAAISNEPFLTKQYQTIQYNLEKIDDVCDHMKRYRKLLPKEPIEIQEQKQKKKTKTKSLSKYRNYTIFFVIIAALLLLIESIVHIQDK